MIIDATNLILGRMATAVAKRALLGEKIDIVNCENAVITGTKADILKRYNQKMQRGIPLQGPYFPKQSDRIVRRTIRGMLPYKKGKGKDVYDNVMCYKGVPESLKDKKIETIEEANVEKSSTLQYIKVQEIAKQLGGN